MIINTHSKAINSFAKIIGHLSVSDGMPNNNYNFNLHDFKSRDHWYHEQYTSDLER